MHERIAPIPDDASRLKVLAWAATPNGDGRRPTVAAIEDRVREVKAQLAQGWTPDQLDRKARAEKAKVDRNILNRIGVTARSRGGATLVWTWLVAYVMN